MSPDPFPHETGSWKQGYLPVFYPMLVQGIFAGSSLTVHHYKYTRIALLRQNLMEILHTMKRLVL